MKIIYILYTPGSPLHHIASFHCVQEDALYSEWRRQYFFRRAATPTIITIPVVQPRPQTTPKPTIPVIPSSLATSSVTPVQRRATFTLSQFMRDVCMVSVE